jgi:hypothetical protein
MDEYRYMAVTRTLTRIPSYRDLLRALAAVGLDLLSAQDCPTPDGDSCDNPDADLDEGWRHRPSDRHEGPRANRKGGCGLRPISVR